MRSYIALETILKARLFTVSFSLFRDTEKTSELPMLEEISSPALDVLQAAYDDAYTSRKLFTYNFFQYHIHIKTTTTYFVTLLDPYSSAGSSGKI